MTKSVPQTSRSRSLLEMTIIVLLIGFGGFYLYQKAGRAAPVQFSDSDLTVGARALLSEIRDNMVLATPHALEQAHTDLTILSSTYPDYPPATAKLALTTAVLVQLQGETKTTNWATVKPGTNLVLQDYPFQKDALLALSWLQFYRDGDGKNAKKTVAKALKQDRYNVYGLALLSDIAADQGKFKLAVRYAQTLALQDPQAMWLRLPGCRYHVRAKQWDSAVKACQQVLQLEPEQKEATKLLHEAQSHL